MTILLAVKILGLVIGVVASVRQLSRKKTGAPEERKGIALLLVLLGFGTAIVAELIDASNRERSAQEALKRNNELLAEVQRTLHPLFPLYVDVAFTAPLTGAPMSALRSRLEAKFKDEQSRDPKVPFVWLHPPGEPLFPRCESEPLAHNVLNAELSSAIKLYGREKTKAQLFDDPDIKFCPCPQLRFYPGGVMVSKSGELPDKWLEARDFAFNPATGLKIDDGSREINLSDVDKSSGEMVSVDDLIGATLEVEVFFEMGECGRNETAPEKDTIRFTGMTIMLPGYRRLFIDRSKFTELSVSEKGGRYRFSFPTTKDEFAKLLRERKEKE